MVIFTKALNKKIMGLLELQYPLETTSTIVGRKRQEASVPTSFNCYFDAVNYLDYAKFTTYSPSFTNFSIEGINTNVSVDFPLIEMDLNVEVLLQPKTSYKLKAKIKSSSKLVITPYLD